MMKKFPMKKNVRTDEVLQAIPGIKESPDIRAAWSEDNRTKGDSRWTDDLIPESLEPNEEEELDFS